jgi:lipopolysaccharide transport system permease protein
MTTASPQALAGSSGPLPVYTIAPSRAWAPLQLGELWAYRELLYFFVWREVKVRYKQTALGIGWAVIQPLMTMVVFSVVFGRLAGMPSEGVPYPVFTFCALLPWQLFAFSLGEASQSVVNSQRVITKVYFPRLLVPLAAVSVGLADFAVASTVLFLLMLSYGIVPGVAVWTLPLWTMLALASALGIGLWLAALNVRYRDVRYTLPFLTQIWLYATPVAYSSSLVPAEWRPLYALNPMVGVVEGFRWALLGHSGVSMSHVALSAVVVGLVLVSGLFYFRRTERTFADLV